MVHLLTDTYDTTNGQLKINEYSYQNKMDTLFLFQILLISLLILCVLAYGARAGFFSNAMFYYILILLVFLDIIIFLGRYSYTANLRDQNTWNRRRFNYQDPAPPAPPLTFSYGGMDLSGSYLTDLCSAYQSRQ
jgi:hypothetical protein